MPLRSNEGFCGEHRTRRQPIMEWRRTIHQVRRVSNTEIRWNLATHSPICFDRLILPRWQPEIDAWEIQADPDDLSEMFETLQVAGIMPPKVAISGTIDKHTYRVGPARVGQAGEPFLHRRLDSRKQVTAAQGIAVVANSFREQL